MATYWENSCSFGLRYVSWYKYLLVSLVFSHLGFWSGNLFLIAPFPDLCLLVPFFFFGGGGGIESVNDTKNNKHNSFNRTIDTTAVYYRYNISFGKTKSFRPRSVKFRAQHTPLSQRFSELVKKTYPISINQHFSYPKRCTALRTDLPEKSTLSHRFLFTHRYTADQGVPSLPPPPPGI